MNVKKEITPISKNKPVKSILKNEITGESILLNDQIKNATLTNAEIIKNCKTIFLRSEILLFESMMVMELNFAQSYLKILNQSQI